MVVTIFGSGRCKPESAEYGLGRGLGEELTMAGYTVCNGGYGGIMEATARGAKEAGGKTIGITVENFGRPNPWIDQEIRAKSLLERLMKLIETGDGFVVLRGGTGTLLELAAVWEMFNKRLMAGKPVIILGGFWTPLLHMMRDELDAEGRTVAAALPIEATTPRDCVRHLASALR